MESVMRRLVVAAVALGALWIAPSAEATINDVFGGAVTCSLQADNDRRVRQQLPPQHGPDLRRRPDRRQRRLPGRRRRGPGRRLPADHDVPRLRRQQDRLRRHGALPGPRLRGLQHDRPRLPRVLRQRGRPDRGRPRLRRRIHPPDRHPLRGARRPVLRRLAGRRGSDRPAADRLGGGLIRRRDVDVARRAARPHDAARRDPGPVDEPGGRARDEDRRRDPEHPLDRHRLLAGPQRRHARLRRRRALPGPHRRHEAVAGRGAVR